MAVLIDQGERKAQVRSKQLTIAIALLLGCSSAQAIQSRAELNYQRLLSGQVQLTDLPLDERAEVMEYDRLLRAQSTREESEAERCWRGEREKDGSPSLLALELIELKCGPEPSPDEPTPAGQ